MRGEFLNNRNWGNYCHLVIMLAVLTFPLTVQSQDAASIKSLCSQLRETSSNSYDNTMCPTQVEFWQQNFEMNIPNSMTRALSPEEMSDYKQKFWDSLRQCHALECVRIAYFNQVQKLDDFDRQIARQEKESALAQREEKEREQAQQDNDSEQARQEKMRLEEAAMQRQTALEQQRAIDAESRRTDDSNAQAARASILPDTVKNQVTTESSSEPESSKPMAFVWAMLPIILPIFLIFGFVWQYIINTFIGPNKRVGYWPSVLVSFVPFAAPLAIPLAIVCFVKRALAKSVSSTQ
jgi:hypothetical protein